jgi:hypothetical protein
MPAPFPVTVSRIQNRRGTQVQFEALYPSGYTGTGGYGNPPSFTPAAYPNVLLPGELALCEDTLKIYIGLHDGKYFQLGTSSGGTGSVTSVNVSGGSTGLTTTGGPITTNGTITLGGILELDNGGTGASTKSGAANNILPVQGGESGKYLKTDGTNVSWSEIPPSDPAAPEKSIQFNLLGEFGGSDNFIFDQDLTKMTIGDSTSTGSLSIDGANSTIQANNTADSITVLPGDEGALVVGPTAQDSIVQGGIGKTFAINSDSTLYLLSATDNIFFVLNNNAKKISVAGPTSTQYATGLAPENLVNKKYIDLVFSGSVSGAVLAISAGGTGGTTVSAAATNLQGTGLETNSVGFRGIPINEQSLDYTMIASDAGKTILHPETDNAVRTYTIPSNSSVAYPIGTAITFINDSASEVIISIVSDTLVQAGTGLTGNRTLIQYGEATAVKISATKWYISGINLE